MEARTTKYRFNPDEINTFGSLVLQDYYMEIKRQQEEAMQNAYKITKDVMAEFTEMSGRTMELVEEYKLEDAEYAFVSYGATAGNAKAVVDRLRDRGEKAGALKIRLHRPFPTIEVHESLREKDKEISNLKQMMQELKAEIVEMRLEKLEKANGIK